MIHASHDRCFLGDYSSTTVVHESTRTPQRRGAWPTVYTTTTGNKNISRRDVLARTRSARTHRHCLSTRPSGGTGGADLGGA